MKLLGQWPRSVPPCHQIPAALRSMELGMHLGDEGFPGGSEVAICL